jgi:hypothetical protein
MSFLPVFPTRLLWMPSKNGPQGFQACLAAGTAPGSARLHTFLLIRPCVERIRWHKFRFGIQQFIRAGNCFVVFIAGL